MPSRPNKVNHPTQHIVYNKFTHRWEEKWFIYIPIFYIFRGYIIKLFFSYLIWQYDFVYETQNQLNSSIINTIFCLFVCHLNNSFFIWFYFDIWNKNQIIMINYSWRISISGVESPPKHGVIHLSFFDTGNSTLSNNRGSHCILHHIITLGIVVQRIDIDNVQFCRSCDLGLIFHNEISCVVLLSTVYHVSISQHNFAGRNCEDLEFGKFFECCQILSTLPIGLT